MKEKIFKKGTVISYNLSSSQWPGLQSGHEQMTLSKDMKESELDSELWQMAVEYLEPEYEYKVLETPKARS